MDPASMTYFLIIFSTEVLITGNVVAKDLRAEQKAMTVFNAYPPCQLIWRIILHVCAPCKS